MLIIENTPVILSMLDTTTGETTKLSPDCSFIITDETFVIE